MSLDCLTMIPRRRTARCVFLLLTALWGYNSLLFALLYCTCDWWTILMTRTFEGLSWNYITAVTTLPLLLHVSSLDYLTTSKVRGAAIPEPRQHLVVRHPINQDGPIGGALTH